MSEDPIRRGVAEFIGTFTLIFIGAGSIIAAGNIHDPSLIGIALALLPSVATSAVKLGVPTIDHGVNAGAAFGLEAIGTFFLVLVVFATAVDPRGTFKSIAGLAIGLMITIDILFMGPYTGAAVNPARAFGPQLIGSHWANGWVWYAGPLLGATVAALLYEFLYLRPLAPEPVGASASGVLEPRASES